MQTVLYCSVEDATDLVYYVHAVIC